MKPHARIPRLLALAVLRLGAPAFAQPSATGAIEGRVSNPATGENLELARITVANLEAARRGETSALPAVESPDYHTARRLLSRDLEFKTWRL